MGEVWLLINKKLTFNRHEYMVVALYLTEEKLPTYIRIMTKPQQLYNKYHSYSACPNFSIAFFHSRPFHLNTGDAKLVSIIQVLRETYKCPITLFIPVLLYLLTFVEQKRNLFNGNEPFLRSIFHVAHFDSILYFWCHLEYDNWRYEVNKQFTTSFSWYF